MDWITSEDEFADATTVQKVVKVDVTRIMREIWPLRRVINANFKVVQSTHMHMRAVLGQNILNELDRQDYGMSCPIQSGIEYDEKPEVEKYLEAAMDGGILAGLPHFQRIFPGISTTPGHRLTSSR